MCPGILVYVCSYLILKMAQEADAAVMALELEQHGNLELCCLLVLGHSPNHLDRTVCHSLHSQQYNIQHIHAIII